MIEPDAHPDLEAGSIGRVIGIHADVWNGYNDIGRYRFTHMVTNVSQSGEPAHVALPHVHRVASLAQRWILGTHQGAIGHEQLDYYLDEFIYTFRFNRRHSRHRGLLFNRLLEGALAAGRSPSVQGAHQRISRIAGPARNRGSERHSPLSPKQACPDAQIGVSWLLRL